MKVDDAIETVVELEIVRARVRDDLAQQSSVRVPLLIWGLLTIGSALVAAPGEGAWLGPYWLLAAPLGMVVVARHFRRGAGLGPAPAATVAAAVATSVAAFAAGWLGGAAAAGLALGAGYVALAVTTHSRTMAWLAAGLLAASATMLVTGVDRAEVVLPATLGGALILAGLATRP